MEEQSEGIVTYFEVQFPGIKPFLPAIRDVSKRNRNACRNRQGKRESERGTVRAARRQKAVVFSDGEAILVHQALTTAGSVGVCCHFLFARFDGHRPTVCGSTAPSRNGTMRRVLRDRVNRRIASHVSSSLSLAALSLRDARLPQQQIRRSCTLWKI